MSDLYVTADTHFWHSRMATHYRPYESVEEMNELMIDAWNSVIGPRDEVWHLGDFSFGEADKIESVFKALHGKRKHLIRGNHDSNGVVNCDWASVQQMSKLKHDGTHFWLCHYPLLTWPNAHKGVLHLHGHSHGNLRGQGTTTRMDVGVDATKEIALSIEEVKHRMRHLTYEYVDHHD